MKSSAISSATGISPDKSTPPRRSFALTGRSRTLDPRTNAVRRDIADVRLAEYVFAPHYAEPVARFVVRRAMLRADRSADSEVLASLEPGDAFELLDVTRDVAWGTAPRHGLVGYVEVSVLGAGPYT